MRCACHALAPETLTLIARLRDAPVGHVKRVGRANLEEKLRAPRSVRPVQARLFMNRRGLAIVIALAIGCGDADVAPPQPTGVVRAAIQGGAPDVSHAFAVGVCVGGRGVSCAGICSGTLIAPNAVLTARHCFDAPTPGPVDCARSRFGGLTLSPRASWVTTGDDFSAASDWHQVAAVVTPEDASFCGSDVAVLVLDVPIAGVPLAEPATSVLAADVGAVEAAIGYGAAAPGDASAASAGRRRARLDVPIVCVPGDPARDCAGRLASAAELLAGDGTCSGDSGSGAFVPASLAGGAPLLLGVFSRGGTSADGARCERAIYTRMDALRPFVASAVRAATETAGLAPPRWITQPTTTRYGDVDAAPAGDLAPGVVPAGDSSGGGCAVTSRGGRSPPSAAWLPVLGAIASWRRRVSARSSRGCRPSA